MTILISRSSVAVAALPPPSRLTLIGDTPTTSSASIPPKSKEFFDGDAKLVKDNKKVETEYCILFIGTAHKQPLVSRKSLKAA